MSRRDSVAAESPDTGTVMAVLRSGETPLVAFVSS